MKYFKVFLEYTKVTEKEFWDIANKWRNENIWVKKNDPNPKIGEEWEKKTKVT